MTPEEIEQEYWACHYLRNPNAADDIESDGYNLDEIIAAMDDSDWEDAV
ncbi:MAG: hypothetical protein HN842_05270 [Gammaproteobacteria bacterium]|jgi:hypothetical protein|nr:hypothetical protein [Gammaproteobacteria bacterium]MBT7307606.1 hypothetical protein [Gammaproteobacteria bacterium]